jgi:hypothetical protein
MIIWLSGLAAVSDAIAANFARAALPFAVKLARAVLPPTVSPEGSA